jgi:hypothetical protein
MKCEDYQLRCAAGKYWLIDMKQTGPDYHKPLCLNEGGAYLWELLQNGLEKEQIITHLCHEFNLPPEEVRQDVEGFFMQLELHQIILQD